MSSFFQLLITSLPVLLQGALVSIMITLCAVLGGFLLAVGIAYLRLHTSGFLLRFLVVYEWFFRGLPILVLLLLLWLILPFIGINLGSFAVIVVGLGLRSSAYQTQIIRGALNSISRVQTEAGLSLGLTRFKSFLHITLPQSLRLSLPGLSNEFTIVLKDSPLAYVVAVAELLKRAENLISSNFRPFELYFICAVIYFIMYLIVEYIFKIVNKRMRSESFFDNNDDSGVNHNTHINSPKRIRAVK